MSYTLLNAVTDVQRHLKDSTENVWTLTDIKASINESILVIKQALPEYFTTLVEVTNNTDVIYIDNNYKNLIPLFASARCFEQDEQYYRATQKMNEFETRLQNAIDKIYESSAYSDLIDTDELESISDVYYDSDESDNISELIP